MLREQSWEGFQQRFGGNIEHLYANGVSSQVIFGLPTAKQVGGMKDNDEGNLTSRAALNHDGFFVNDTWSAGRVTASGGVRYDRYHGWLPEQEQLAATVGRVRTGRDLPGGAFLHLEPLRPALRCHLRPHRRWQDRAERPTTASTGTTPASPLPAWPTPIRRQGRTYTWNDANGDRRWQPGEEGATPQSLVLQGAVRLDPDIKAPYSHEASVFLERQIGELIGVRTGFVYKTEDDLLSATHPIVGTYQPGRPLERLLRAVPVHRYRCRRSYGHERRSDGHPARHAHRAGRKLPDRLGCDESAGCVRPLQDRRGVGDPPLRECWSGQIGFGYTWTTNFPEGFPQNPNQAGVYDRTGWGLKASGSYDAAWGIRLSPVLRHQSGVNFARQISVPAAPRRPSVSSFRRRPTTPKTRAPAAKTTSGCLTFAPRRR